MKKRKTVLLAEVRQDLKLQARWYEKRSPGLGAAFANAVKAAVDSAVQWPFAAVGVKAGVRRKWLSRFPYSVVYLVNDREIVFIGIMHGAQDLRRWVKRRLGTEEE